MVFKNHVDTNIISFDGVLIIFIIISLDNILNIFILLPQEKQFVAVDLKFVFIDVFNDVYVLLFV